MFIVIWTEENADLTRTDHWEAHEYLHAARQSYDAKADAFSRSICVPLTSSDFADLDSLFDNESNSWVRGTVVDAMEGNY